MFFFCILSNVNNGSIIQMSSSTNLEGFPNAPPMQSQNILERTHEVLQYPYNIHTMMHTIMHTMMHTMMCNCMILPPYRIIKIRP